MIQKTINGLVVACLSLLLLFGASAKEYVHLFAHHEDTIHNPDHVCPKGETHFEDEHHHCSFLHFILEPFAQDSFVPRITHYTEPFSTAKRSVFISRCTSGNESHSYLRGPPACTI